MNWAVSFPEKRLALTHLRISEEITPATQAAGHKTMEGIAELLERSRANGSMRTAPMAFVLAIVNSVAEATMEVMARDTANAKKHCRAGFDALWRMVA